ncbi:MAG: outer membrane beta-barrel protein [Pseudomonas sp.]
MKSIRRLALTLAAPTVLPASAWAVEPQSIDVFGLQFTPTLAVKESYDDNFRELEHDKESSWITSITPKFELLAEDRNSAYRATYEANSDIYHDASDASNTDHKVLLESIMEFTSSQRLKLEAGYKKIEETSDTAVAEENDKYHATHVGGLYTFGSAKANNRLDFGANYEELRYDNSGDINADEERDTTALNAVWYHRLGGSTNSLVEVRHYDFDYVQKNSPRNGTTDAVLVGGTWDATAKTTGKARVGYAKKKFDDDSRDDLSSPMWEVGVDWLPLTYSKFSLVTTRAFDEGDDGSDAIKNTSTSLAWAHGWTPRITSTVKYEFGTKDYEGQNRSDDLSAIGFDVSNKLGRGLDIAGAYTYRENDSDAADQSYKRNIYMISLTGSL